MAITYGAQGAGGNGTTSCAPTYPTGISADTSALFAIVCGRSSVADTGITWPSGWSRVVELEGGAGTFGVDTGPRRIGFFRKDTVTGSETGSETFSFAAGSGQSTITAAIFRIEKTSGWVLSAQGTSGADATNDTSFSVTSSGSLEWATNDLLMVGVAQNIDTGTRSSISVSATGVTFGTRSARMDIAVTTGSDVRRILDTVPVTSAATTTGVSYSHTISAAGSGVAGFVLLREVSTGTSVALVGSGFTASTGTVSVPRTNGQAAEFSQGSIASVTVARALTGATITSSQGATTANSDGTVALSGQGVTGQAGAVAASWGQDLTGSEITGGHGSLTVTIRPSDPVGQSITSATGTLTPSGGGDLSAHLSGVEAQFAQGNVQGGTFLLSGQASTGATGSTSLDLSVALVGSAGAFELGTISASQDAVETLILSFSGAASPQASVALAGSEITGEQGAFEITGDSDTPLTGEASTVSAGSVAVDKQFPLAGLQIDSAQYNVGAPGGAALSGAEVSVIAGSIFTDNDRTFALSGQAITAQDGITFASSLGFATGQEIAVQQQTIGPFNVALSGLEITAEQGFMALMSRLKDAGIPARKTARRYRVEIDGEVFEVGSPQEAEALLEAARQAAEETAKQTLERALKAEKRPVRKVVADARKSLVTPTIVADEELTAQAQELARAIEQIYGTTLQNVEIAVRLRDKDEDDEEDIIGMLL